MNSKEQARFRVLLGPCSLQQVDRVRWPLATVKYLKTTRDPKTHSPDYIYYDAESIRRSVTGMPVDRELAEWILLLNADPNCFLLAERDRSSFFNGAFLASTEIANCARYAWSILKGCAPDLIVFHNHPHGLFTYIVLKSALRLGVPVLLVHFSALPWRMCISRYSKDATLTRCALQDNCNEVERASITSYMRRLQAGHEGAIPSSDLRLMSAKTKPLYFGEELRGLLKGSILKNAMRISRKWAVYRAFTKFVRHETRSRYVAFLMHYQPEETTIPRGGMFAQQLNAIVKLRALLPADIGILVKENRATFRAPLILAMGVRSYDFYRTIASLPDTFLVPLEYDTFTLVDGSLAVATITGSVGLEALCRGKRVIIFGDANYESFSGVLNFAAPNLTSSDLLSIVDGSPHNPAETERDLLAEVRQSIGPAVENNRSNSRAQQSAAVEAFEYISRNLERLAASATATTRGAASQGVINQRTQTHG
jgi:hypothetical protein